MRLGVHLLGSRDGYRTIAASPDISPDERATLEALVFGQTNDAAYLASLEREPAVFVRHMPSGRIAVTRLFAGARDDAGRATLELRTLVMDGGDYVRLVRADLERVLSAEALWSAARFVEGRTLEVASPPPGAPAPITQRELMVMDAWLQARGQPGATAVLDDSIDARRAVLAFVRAVAVEDLAHCRWGLRLLSLACDVDLATAVPHHERGRRVLMPVNLRGAPLLEPVRFLAGGSPLVAPLPASRQLLAALSLGESATVDSGASVGVGGVAGTAHRKARARNVAIAVLALVGAVVMIAGVVIVVIVLNLRAGSSADAPTSSESSTPSAPAPRSDINPRAADATRREDRQRSEDAMREEERGGADRVSSVAPSAAPAATVHRGPPPITAPSIPPASAAPLPKAPVPAAPHAPTAPMPPSSPPTESAPPQDATAPIDTDGEAFTSALLDRIKAEERYAQSEFDLLVASTKLLQETLDGPEPGKRWDDHPTEWSKRHCTAAASALDDFDRALDRQSLVYLAPNLLRFVEAGANAIELSADRNEFLDAVPTIAAGLASLRLLSSEGGGNAFATRSNAVEALGHANCEGSLYAPIAKRTKAFSGRLRDFLGADPKGRPQADRVSGARKRLQAVLSAGLKAHGEDLAPAIVTQLKRLTRN